MDDKFERGTRKLFIGEGKCKRNEHTGEEFRDKGKSKYKKKEILVARKSPSKKLPK